MSETPEFSIFNLSNGMKVVHKIVDRPIAHCGLMINAGTRDEASDENGLAHFLEHALFKGTTKRKSFHILNRMDSVGGEIDAYTTKEMTCFYSSFLSEYYERAIELLADITHNSTFPPAEIEKEKEVVIDEIKVYLDSPSDQIYDDFEAQVFEGHALGNSILGTADSVRSFDQQKLQSFVNRMYVAPRMVFTSVGNISEKRLKKMLEKHLSVFSDSPTSYSREAFKFNTNKSVTLDRQTYQTHCMMGKATYGADHADRIALILLNNMLGGPAMNSILNLKVREKYGFTYNIESNYAIYQDSGLFSIYLGTDPKYLDKCLKAIHKELKLLRDKKLSSSKLHQAKQQLKGQLAIARESNTNLLLSYGKSLLMHDRIDLLETTLAKIDALKAEDLFRVANENLNEGQFDYLIYEGK